MRTSFILGVAAIVVIVGAVAFFALRSNHDVSEDSGEEEAAELGAGDGQFFQMVPDSALMASPSPLVVTAKPSPSAGAAAGETVTITIDETGFSPGAVTVAVGTEVTFVNNGQAAHWPASDSHPTHNILPGFDAKRGLATGESYTYTFVETGTWRCHDHLMPQLSCTIIVSE